VVFFYGVMKMTKDSVLSILLTAGECVSGESMSRELGISRAAVNAAVQTLRQEGYVISSSTRTGYTLASSPDKLRDGEMAARLGGRAEKVVCLDSVGSTNDYLKLLAKDGAPEGTVVAANTQTAGRGRMGRSFLSPENEGVYLSILLRPDCAPESVPQLTAWVAVAMRRALESSCGVSPGIKWVNDLVLGGRKLGGILTEMAAEGESGHIEYIVAGIGINVGQTAFPEELSAMATSLYLETGKHFSRCALACAMIRELDALTAAFPLEKAAYLEDYRAACVTLGREVTFPAGGQTRSARAEGIDEDFGLSVRFADGHAETLRSGEVSVRGLYGYV